MRLKKKRSALTDTPYQVSLWKRRGGGAEVPAASRYMDIADDDVPRR